MYTWLTISERFSKVIDRLAHLSQILLPLACRIGTALAHYMHALRDQIGKVTPDVEKCTTACANVGAFWLYIANDACVLEVPVLLDGRHINC